jgi:hypothetical protein
MWFRATGPDMTGRSPEQTLGSRIHSSRSSGILLAGDLLAIGVFVVAGEIQHGRPPAAGVPTFLEFAAGWLIAAVAVGAYGTTPISSPGRATLLAGGGWLLGASIGHLIRALVEPGFRVSPTFYLVTLGVGCVLLVGWRLLAWALL